MWKARGESGTSSTNDAGFVRSLYELLSRLLEMLFLQQTEFPITGAATPLAISHRTSVCAFLLYTKVTSTGYFRELEICDLDHDECLERRIR